MISPHPSEPELLRRCVKGDTAAFGTLVNHYQDVVFNLAYRMLGDRDDASDVAQEVFIKAYRNIGAFERRSSLATWLYSIATNESISQRRRAAATSRDGGVAMSALDGGGDCPFDPPGDAPAPDKPLKDRETRRQIERAIADLDDEHRSVVLLREMEGLDYSSIASVLGCTIGTVKSRLHRARLQLRSSLRHVWAGS